MIDLRKIKETCIKINNMNFFGRNINITNNKIIIDGVDVSSNFKNDKEINISIVGDINDLSVDSCNKIKITGNANKVKTMSGDISCSDVNGDVTTTSGDIVCGNINSSATTVSGDIKAKVITGNCKTVSGDISK